MSSAEQPGFVSVEDYLTAEAQALTKSEYIDGWVRAMTGATNRHNRVTMNCLLHLGEALKGQRCRPCHSDTKVRIRAQGTRRFYYPDVQVVCLENSPTEVFQDSPVLIIEVLSPATRRYDLDEKLAAYLTIPSLQCHVVLEQHQPQAIVFRRAADGFLRTAHDGIDATIALPFLGCALPLRAVYEGIEFTPTCVQEEEPAYELD